MDLNKVVKFSLGQIFCTPGIFSEVSLDAVTLALMRHQTGDWGDICEEDAQENELALEQGFRLLSVYHSENKIRFWIITEADRSVTTILLPNEY